MFEIEPITKTFTFRIPFEAENDSILCEHGILQLKNPLQNFTFNHFINNINLKQQKTKLTSQISAPNTSRFNLYD